MKNKKGFTLIELLVAMTIVAVLMGLALVSYQGARKSARDGRRKSDLEQIRGALEMCWADDGEYPTNDIVAAGSVTCVSGTAYMSPTLTDPINADTFVYTYTSDGSTYNLCADLETETVDYCVTNP